MKIVLILSLNIFFNVLHLEQNYFRKKYEYFNKKYNIRLSNLNKTISLNERLSYGFKNAIIPGLISFLICFIIQCIINYFFFNQKKYLIKFNNNNKNISTISAKEIKTYKIFFGVGFILMIIIFYTVITFNEVYRGGASDLFAATIWTFLFLQIIPFLLFFSYLFH